MTEDDLKELKRIAGLLETQDNRSTNNPIYLVQEKQWLTAEEDVGDEHRVWVRDSESDDGRASAEDTARILELHENWEDIPERYSISWEQMIWVTSSWHLIEEEAEKVCARLSIGNRPGDWRVYADSLYQSKDLMFIRKILPLLVKEDGS
jgi:hypothetical protein